MTMAYYGQDEELAFERLPDRERPCHRAYQLLRFAVAAVPIAAGIDKVFGGMVSWEQYLAPTIANLLPMSVTAAMRIVGVLEILTGLLVAVRPRLGGVVAGLWLCGIVVNLLLVPGFYDIALRDAGLALAAFALSRLSIQINETDDEDAGFMVDLDAHAQPETRRELEHQRV
jgi:hypothetical protein